MITNLIATIIISVVTNWTDIHDEQIPWYSVIPCGNYTTSTSAVYLTDSLLPDLNGFQIEQPKRKYLGKDGVVVRITEINFNYEDKPRVHRIEEPLEKITMRCHDKEPERIWDAPIREKLK